MVSTLVTSIALTLNATESDANDLQALSTRLPYPLTKSLANGTGSGQANIIFSDTVTLTASSTADLDLVGSLLNAVGKTMTFTKLKLLLVKAAAANTNSVIVSRPAANGVPLFGAASDAVSVTPDGWLVLLSPGAGITVTADTGDLITFTNSAGGTSVVYDVVLIGVGTLA